MAPGIESRQVDEASPRGARRSIAGIALVGNLLGALLTFFYFQFVDPIGRETPVEPAEIAFFAVAFSALMGLVYWHGRQWTLPLMAGAGTRDPEVRRRAATFPLGLAALNALAWVAAGVLWGVVEPLMLGRFTVSSAVRLMFGITVVAGTAATAFVFFAVERRWRSILPRFFPEDDLRSAPGAIRLPVRARLLAVFLMASVIPLALLGVLAYTQATALRDAGPAASSGMIGSLLVLIVFIVLVGTGAAIGLSLFVASSVAAPLGQVEAAMAEVERGHLGVRCPVVSHDEIGAVADGFNRMVQGLRERDFVKETFGKYVSREVRDEILAGRVALEGQVIEVTILFSDLRDFTPWVEASDPRAVVRDLNAYFTEMEAAIRAHRGLVLQYIGDEIEAVFGAPLPVADHADMAVRAALDMRHRLAAWNAGRPAGQATLRHGIGIHTGSVLAGNIGSAERLSYALVGDAVNLASRIQGLNKDVGSDILVSGATRRRLGHGFELAPLPAVRVKGRSADVEVFQLQ
jgi:class 3 adenylate cyclase